MFTWTHIHVTYVFDKEKKVSDTFSSDVILLKKCWAPYCHFNTIMVEANKGNKKS
jgi:hypothetical protein